MQIWLLGACSWSFFKCKIALQRFGKDGQFTTDIHEPSLPKIHKTYWAIILWLTASMIYLWYSLTFSFQPNSGNYVNRRKKRKVEPLSIANAKDGARHTRHTRHRHTRHTHTGHPGEASKRSSSWRNADMTWLTSPTTFKDWTVHNGYSLKKPKNGSYIP